MGFGNLAEFGRSTSGMAWATNPVRRVLWWLIAPFFRGASVRITAYIAVVERATNARIDQLAATVSAADGAANARIDALAATISAAEEAANARIDALAAASAAASPAGSEALTAGDDAKNWQDLATAAFASQMGGLRKDSYAVAQRIAGLEEEQGKSVERVAELARELHAVFDGLDRRYIKLERDLDEIMQGAAVSERFNGLDAAIEELRGLVKPSPDERGLVLAKSPTGDRLLVRPHDHIGSLILAGKEWEPHVREAIEDAAASDGVAVDAGAYIGIHTMTMARCFRTVHAFEPQTGILQVLGGNLALNERSNVVTHPMALYDRKTGMKLASQERQEVDLPMRNGQILYRKLSNAAALTFEVANEMDSQTAAIPLDELGLKNVKLIKVDAQGADLHVLRGARETIASCRPIILFEWEQDLAASHGTKLDDLHTFLSELDYDVAVLHETTPDRQLDYIAKPRAVSAG
ncbi:MULTISPECIES: FkbM family methyltransferase [unclassified Methylobacterium]|uniref:Methyltransferase FkbM domain-containing protein n=4 Tax=Pseudomonadota TaxID=1224 RepID=A0ABQ4SUU6_9HYPH|nr:MULTISPECIES: FkbM family methyltransferase [unclassified Methylobacterium]GJE05544.1 hypothetical protein AOPFMNJM_0844 [Methylobacterium jeotgali]